MLFDLGLILLVGLAFAKFFEFLKLPGIIGMILSGVLLGSLDFMSKETLDLSSTLRELALIIILSRAGLTLNIKELKKSSHTVFLLSFLPATLEILAVSFISQLLFNMDLISSLILGAVISAVSPAIIVPRMISFKNQGLGKTRNVPDIILASASVDDIYVIVLFYSFISFDTTNLLLLPLNIILGIAFGVIFGFIISFVSKYATTSKFTVLFLATSFLLLHFDDSIPFSALLAIMTMGITVNARNHDLAKKTESNFFDLWTGFSIFLFAFVGISINLDYVFNFSYLPIVVIIFALIFRSLGTFLSVYKSKLTKKEKIFCIFSYIPKATVQAGIGYIPLSLGLPYGELILTLSAISIIITAPLGAILIDRTSLLD